MNFKEIESKWQKKWEAQGINSFDKSQTDNKYYVLEMFTYPSAANLHIGHCYNFAPADAYARFKKMQGYNVFQPMGFDAFGLPAENYAIKTGVHPQDCTQKNIEIIERQLKSLGAMYDWGAKVITCSPDYYRWTQWMFLQFYKHGLVYQKNAPINWCVSCSTAIANEQVIDGKCERCDSEVIKKNQKQWFFKITDYAEELLTGLDKLDWPEKTKAMQRNWIGKSTGGEISFLLENSKEKITVFTTRADTLMGVSYVVLAPEHQLVNKITTTQCAQAVKEYQYKTSKISDIERLSDKGQKTGVFTGAYCIHPITNQIIPVWIADYCLSTYGTGAVMGVAAHDTRDYDFAKKYNLEIKRVIKSADNQNDDLPFTEYGILVNSGKFDGLSSDEAQKEILACLNKINCGGEKINYRLRDWSVSRQRYWGCPIPIIHCDKCGAVAVDENDLPVLLPYDVNFTPDGKSPLIKNADFINVKCPKCGGKATREADTLDVFVDSSWYFLRYPDNKNSSAPFDSRIINKMLPVDVYVGGAEHACMHLLYSRFFVKALRDMGYLDFDEPFKRLIHQGMILGSDGEKMSKSKGNVINPDKYIEEYGCDTLRMYLMFGFSYIDGGPWSDEGIKAVYRFLERAERIIESCLKEKASLNQPQESDADLEYAVNYCIKNVRQDLEAFSFNTSIARMMELVNAMYKYSADKINGRLFYETGLTLIKLLAPFAPHLSEELNEKSGNNNSVFVLPYPKCDESKLIKNEIEIAVQINSKIVNKIYINPRWPDSQITDKAVADSKVSQILNGRNIKKAIVIKDRLINLIV